MSPTTRAGSTRATCKRCWITSPRTARSRSIPTTRSWPGPRSRATARSCTSRRAPRSPEEPRDRSSAHRADDLHPRGLRRARGDLARPDDAAHAADVGDERDPRHRARRRDPRRRRCRRAVQRDRRLHPRLAGVAQRLRRIRRDRAHAADVPPESPGAETARGRCPMTGADTAAASWVDIAYLITAICFIFGLRYLSSPKTARLGNRVSAVGMLIAVVATLSQGIVNWYVIGAALGGGAAALVAAGELLKVYQANGTPTYDVSFTSVLSAVIGAISFAGSIIAFLKLQEVMTGRPITYPGQQIVNALVALAILVCWGLVVANVPNALAFFWIALVASFVLGILFVLPIGGADMPVVISLLNSFTGLAAASTGFVLGNNVLIVAGALVGASGTLLTVLMGKAMNRSVTNVLFGAFGAIKTSTAAGAAKAQNVRSVSADDVAAMLAYANQVIVVPGYGMAVAQAQHSIRALAYQREKEGVEVKYAIHPVDGRMPGHMYVLLAEANVPYTSLYDMDDINPEFERTDVALVVGANDVTNPAARSDKNSPIYGMPILDVDKAANVVVLKRSMNSGFAGIDNPLFDDPKTVMLFGDAKKSIDGVIAGVKAL